jgi:hypothetical protein
LKNPFDCIDDVGFNVGCIVDVEVVEANGVDNGGSV